MRQQNPDEAFAKAIAARDSEIDLGRAALTLASAFEPGVDIDGCLGMLDRMAAELSGRLITLEDGRSKLAALVAYLATELGFRGNEADFEDPRNSYLDQVLNRRLGIPITLSIVYMEVGRRAGVLLEGVGYPSHFLVRWIEAGNTTYLDPYTRGQILTEADLLELLRRAGLEPSRGGAFLAAVTKRQILTRMLNNLKASFARRGQPAGSLQAVELLLVMAPWDLDHHRDRGLLAMQLDHPDVAVTELEVYLSYRPEADDTQWVRGQLELARRASPPGRSTGPE